MIIVRALQKQDDLHDLILRAGNQVLHAYTATSNQGAIRFYEQRGMTPLQTVMLGQVTGNEND